MLIALPLGLWTFSFICDLIFFFVHSSPTWSVLAWYTMAGGVIGALFAAIPGFIDWLSLTPGTKTKTIGTYHMVVNLVAVVLYALNWYWRWRQQTLSAGPVALSFVLILLLCISGWLGGELVYKHKVGVSSSD